MSERIVCLDIGDVRIGVAVSDPTGTIASPIEVITRVGWGPDTRKIAAVCERYETRNILSGLPRNMDGSEGPRAEKSREFALLLERESGITPVLWDERRSSVEAHAILHANGRKMKDHRRTVDAVAASLLLEGYLSGHTGG